MAKGLKGKALVVDASIARACGGPEATHPTPIRCRDFLEAVLQHQHQVVMTHKIRQEWDKHQSRFAQKWLRQVISRNRLVPVKDVNLNEELWTFFEAQPGTDKQRAEIAKDLHLLEAAIQTDECIASLDENTARKCYTEAAAELALIASIVWVNPDKSEETPLEWLAANAPAEPSRMLGYRPE